MALSKIDGANMLTGTIPTSVAPGKGKILQVSNMSVITSSQALATQTSTDLTGFSINITPISSSSKILMFANINLLNGAGAGYGIRFLRDSTQLIITAQAYANYISIASTRSNVSLNFIVTSHISTSHLTY